MISMTSRFEKVLLVLVFFVFVVPFFIIVAIRIQGDKPEEVFCTMEAKMCPDGSYVGRSGPSCEFAECPKVNPTETDTAKINQKIINKGVSITPLEVVSDSRCPSNVQCIWEGKLELRVGLENGQNFEQVNFELGETVIFSGHNVSLKSADPYPKEGKQIEEGDYKFTFLVEQI